MVDGTLMTDEKIEMLKRLREQRLSNEEIAEKLGVSAPTVAYWIRKLYTLPERRKHLVHTKLEDDVYEGIWEIVKKRFVSPLQKFHVIVNEALREYIEKHREEPATSEG